MRAINDALRRASSAAKTPTGAPPAPPALPPMNVLPPQAQAPPPAPVTPPPIIAALEPPLPPLRIEPSAKRSKMPLILALVLVCCIGGGAAFYFVGKGRLVAQAREKMQPGGGDAAREHLATLFGDPKAVSEVATGGEPSNSVSVKPTTAPAKIVTPTAVIPKPAPTATAPAVPRAPVQFPPLRLQSIFYRRASPSVMINGKTLFVDDQINGVTIADIQPSSVTLVLSGQTNVLTLR